MLKIIFDLDGTLYSFKDTGIGRDMRNCINTFLTSEPVFNCPTLEEADALAELYYKKYGLTARGIQVELKVSDMILRKYTSYVHGVDFDNVTFKPELVEATQKLAAMPHVQLWVLTNATKQHAGACLAQLGVSNAFRCPKTGNLRIVDCYEQWAQSPQHTAECKPLRPAYEYMMHKVCNAQPGDTFVMVEDALRNLTEPKALGWKTMFIHDGRDELAAEATNEKHSAVVHRVMDGMPFLFDLAKETASASAAAS